jgi:hypothetical protein
MIRRRSLVSGLVCLGMAVFGSVTNLNAEGGGGGGAGNAAAAKAETKDFSVEGYYVEACSCKAPCPCEMTGASMGCKGVAAFNFEKGTYGGEDFSGTKVALSLYLGESVHLYIDQSDAKKRAAAEKFMRAAFAAFGPVKGVHESKVEISGKDGAYTVKVDGGKVMACTTEPVLGGDKKTPIVHQNTQDVVNPTMYQGQCVSCTYTEGDMKINLDKGKNAYFNQHMKTSGKV